MMVINDLRTLYSQNSMADPKDLNPSRSNTSTIHSGHFMVSRVHDVNNEDDDDEEVAAPFNEGLKDFDFITADREIYRTYNFSDIDGQSVSIDASLTKLFECMTLAYSGKITSPRWKQFRGLHLSQKQRIRLNNLIWREWHMQYIYGKPPMVCQFAMPLSDHVHSKPEAVVLEGKYWKRQLDAVTAEYKKWRRYFKERVRRQSSVNFWENLALSERELLERVKEVTFIPHSTSSYMSNTDLNLSSDDITEMDLTYDLFTYLNQGFPFPDPRERSQLSCADLIQPCLVPLQPILEEIMDIDYMQDLSSSKTLSSFSSAFMTDSSPNFEVTLGGLHNSDLSLENFLIGSTSTASDTTSVPLEISSTTSSVENCNNAASFVTETVGTTQDVAFQLISGGHYRREPSAALSESSLTQSSPPTITLVQAGLYNSNQNSASSDGAPHRHVVTSSSDLLAQLIELQQQQQQPLEAMLAPKSHHRHQQSSVQIQSSPSLHQQLMSQPAISRRQSPGLVLSQTVQSKQAPASNQTWQKTSKINTGISHSGLVNATVNPVKSVSQEVSTNNSKKKDGLFTVPVAKPFAPRKQNRVIAPAPSQPAAAAAAVAQPSPPSSLPQASYLAELLKSGTYPGALINVKKESQSSMTTSSPIKTTTNFYQHGVPSYNPSFSQQILNCTAFDKVADQSLSGAASTSSSENVSPFAVTVKEPSVRYSHGTDAALLPSVSMLPKSPVASPPVGKRTPSPVSVLDVSSFAEPVSPFSSSVSLSPAMPISPSGLSAPESPGSSESSFGENRRASHLSAEQIRRFNLKTGFDMLQQLVPSLSQNPKVSKATMLQKTAEYCKKLKNERAQMQKESAILKQEIEALNAAISMVQSQLPETGVPVTRQRKDQMREMFDEYVRVRTQENSKFWIFSVIMNTLYDSYCIMVSTSSVDEFCRTSLRWLDQSCSLVTLRPGALNALRKLSTSTPILTEPQKMKDYALQAVSKKTKGYRSNNMMARQ